MIEIGDDISLEDVRKVADKKEKVIIADKAKEAVIKSNRLLQDKIEKGAKIYGVSTGFGKLSDVQISATDRKELQLNLVRSHSCGLGPYLSEEEVRVVMLLRAHTLAKGYSGVRLELIQLLVKLLNEDIYPVIPSQGSVGASGDLAPLAHLALVLIGEGKVLDKGKEYPANEYLKAKGIEPIILQEKEGLSLINGTQVSTAIALMAFLKAQQLSQIADIAAAISTDALKCTDKAFDERIISLRPYKGALKTAENLRKLLSGSEIMKSHRDCPRIQDNYSIRCVPQVHGAIKDALDFIQGILVKEINSISDNPIILSDGEILNGGNFHGEPIAMAMDLLSIVMTQLANISERRIFLLTADPENVLPPFLINQAGLNSGFMIAQVAAASLLSENKVLSHPASIDSIPTSANKEDYVSMSTTAARKAKSIVENTEKILAIELIAGCQALDFHSPLKSSPIIEEIKKIIRSKINFLEKDRILSYDINEFLKIPLTQFIDL